MIDGIQFVHCAIPDMALKEADTRYRLSEGFTLPYPIAVQAASEEEAIRMSGSMSGTPIAFRERIFLGGKLAGSLSSSHTIDVSDGLEVAKAIRMDNLALPCIGASQANKMEMLIKQLKIAMFLTNSSDISALSRAPIYRMK